MAVNSKFSHVGLNGSNTADRLVIVTKVVATSYNENIGVTEGQINETTGTVFTVMWVCDCNVLNKGHRKNILGDLPEIGVGVY